MYRTKEGELSSVRRSIAVAGETEASDRILRARLCDGILRPEDGAVDAHLTIELTCLGLESRELSRIGGVTLLEDEPVERETVPSLTLVRAEGESLWELAKTYRSSEEEILKANPDLEELRGKMLLIPSCS